MKTIREACRVCGAMTPADQLMFCAECGRQYCAACESGVKDRQCWICEGQSAAEGRAVSRNENSVREPNHDRAGGEEQQGLLARGAAGKPGLVTEPAGAETGSRAPYRPMVRCVCRVPVFIDDDRIQREFVVGEVVEGVAAEWLLDRYAGIFTP